MGTATYQEKIMPFVQKANSKEVSLPRRHAYERLIFLILAKECHYTPKRFVQSRLFTALGLRAYGNEKNIDLKKRLSDIRLQYDDNLSLACVARQLHQTPWHNVVALEKIIPHDAIRTKLYNYGAMVGVNAAKGGTIGDFLRSCVSLQGAHSPYACWQEGFAKFRGVGGGLIEQMKLILQHYGIDPDITAVELEYLAALR